MQSLCTPVAVPDFIEDSDLAFRLKFLFFPGKPIFLDIILAIMVITPMAKLIVKVAAAKSSFRIVIPQKLVQKMHWENVQYLIIEEHFPEYLKIRRLFDDEKPEGQNR